MNKEEIKTRIINNDISYIRLIFTDLSGILKNVEVPSTQIDRILDGKVTFDGSSIEGFVRIVESDMLLVPDLDTYREFSWENNQYGKVAGMFCDIYTPSGEIFKGDTRRVLKNAILKLKELGYDSFHIGFEPEFYLLKTDKNGNPLIKYTDEGSYFDLAPVDTQVDCRRAIVNELIKSGFDIEACHHEVGPGQHEINFAHDEVLSSCDNVQLFKLIVKNIARRFNVHATFMPKIKADIAGSGMHTNMSIFNKQGDNIFYDKNGELELSKEAYYFIGGINKHIQSICLLTNSSVNSFKRLVPGFEAPCYVSYSDANRSALIRIPSSRGRSTRCELRMVDPTCNPYIAMSAVLIAGIDGIKNKIDPGKPIHDDIFKLSDAERKEKGIKNLPNNLYDAITSFKESSIAHEILNDHLFNKIITAKTLEWDEYRKQVHEWEIRRYINRY
jgi:glutamine synthetase